MTWLLVVCADWSVMQIRWSPCICRHQHWRCIVRLKHALSFLQITWHFRTVWVSCIVPEHPTYRKCIVCQYVCYCSVCAVFSLSTLMLLVGIRKSISPVKNWVMGCWHAYLSRARCKWFAYGPADATATPLSLASLKSRMVYLPCAGLPRLFWKKGH